MTDQTLDDQVRKIIEKMHHHANDPYVGSREKRNILVFAQQLAALIPPPPRPTLADMTEEERRACQWMQADAKTWGRVVIIAPDLSGGSVALLDRWGDVAYEGRARVTPRPDLPRMEWPGDQGAAPSLPAMPGGWRLADHPDYGRVIVTNPTPNRDGRVYYVLPTDDPLGFDWFFCTPDDLAYIDQEADQ